MRNNSNKNRTHKNKPNAVANKKKSLNNTYNILNTNLNNLHTVNINSPEWNITPGNRHPERIPRSLNFKPVVPKMKLPAFLRGGKRTRRIQRKN